MTAPRTLFDRVWDAHVVVPETEGHPAVLYVDLHLLHEVTSPQAFAALTERGLPVRCPKRALATLDHATPTTAPDAAGQWPAMPDAAARQVEALVTNCARHQIEVHTAASPDRGIVHVMAPELGATWPGATIVCGDSHTSTHGAFGALAFGIGTSEVGHVLATQCLLQRRPRTLAIHVDGALAPGVGAKDLALALIAHLGTDGGRGSVIEYLGATPRRLSMAGRMTLCNMTIEAGARAGMIAPDGTTFAWLEGRARAPRGADWERRVDYWRTLRSDPDAAFDATVHFDAAQLAPQVTWGTTPAQTTAIDAVVPEPTDEAAGRALDYMALRPGQALGDTPVQVAFIGSCTNGRIEDLLEAAQVLRGRRVAAGVRLLVVPGSQRVKAAAEAGGLDAIFRAAGAEWREPGCSMCIAMNGDVVPSGQAAISTSNRNFRGRQGPGARTFLAGPATVAASAVAGVLADPRPLTREVGDG
ncbi:MAG: 3-isopropylmalate dehydratase large subunit [Planctomycetota bacterium]